MTETDHPQQIPATMPVLTATSTSVTVRIVSVRGHLIRGLWPGESIMAGPVAAYGDLYAQVAVAWARSMPEMPAGTTAGFRIPMSHARP